MMFWKQLLITSTLCCTSLAWTASSPIVKQPHVQASLVSNVEQITPGQSLYIGLYLQPDPDWHVYWQNPGDSGLAPTLRWEAVDKITIGTIHWPFPQQIPVQHLMNYGYKGNVLLPVSVTADQQIVVDEITLQAQANWLACKETCIPGKAQLRLSLPVNKQPLTVASPQQTLFQKALAKVPKTLPLQGAPVQISDKQIAIQLYAKSQLFKQAKTVTFFPITENLVEYAAPTTIEWRNNVLRMTQTKSSSFSQPPASIEGVIVINDNQAWRFNIPSS